MNRSFIFVSNSGRRFLYKELDRVQRQMFFFFFYRREEDSIRSYHFGIRNESKITFNPILGVLICMAL